MIDFSEAKISNNVYSLRFIEYAIQPCLEHSHAVTKLNPQHKFFTKWVKETLHPIFPH